MGHNIRTALDLLIQNEKGCFVLVGSWSTMVEVWEGEAGGAGHSEGLWLQWRGAGEKREVGEGVRKALESNCGQVERETLCYKQYKCNKEHLATNNTHALRSTLLQAITKGKFREFLATNNTNRKRSTLYLTKQGICSYYQFTQRIVSYCISKNYKCSKQWNFSL